MKRVRHISFFVALILVIISVPADGQFRIQKIVKHYSLTQGLSQSVVNSIAEDDQSFVWFATEDGLNRFDGTSFQVFKYGKAIGDKVPDNFVQSILKDRDGDLWSSSRSGLVQFDKTTEQFSLYQHNFAASQSASPNDVSCIAQGASDFLWIGWYGNGFGSFQKSTKTFTGYNLSNLTSHSSDLTVTLIEDQQGFVWVGTQNGGVNVFSTRNGKVVSKIESLSNPTELPSQNVKVIIEDANKNIWIGTSQGLVVYVRERNKFLNFDKNPLLAKKSIFSLLADDQNQLWIGTQNNGLFRCDLSQLKGDGSQRINFNKVSTLDEYDLSKKTIQSLYQDKNKNLWISAYGDGIYMISNEEQHFIQFKKQAGLFNPVSFYGMCYDRAGNLWLGTDGNGLYMRAPEGTNEVHYKANGNGLTENAILSALCDSKGRLWFGTYASGVFLFDKKSQTFTQYKYRGVNASLPGVNDVRVLFEDSKGNLWVGTNRGGLCSIDVASRRYTTPANFQDVLQGGDIRCISENKDGKLIIGFYGNGLYSYDPANKKLEPYFKGSVQSAIKTSIVYSVRFDDQERLWVGTGGNGIYMHDPAKDSATHLTEEEGLINNTVYSILTDRNAAWVSTNSGISRIDLQSLKITNYDVDDGLQEGQFNPGSGVFNPMAGYMCFGGTQGLNVFYPEQVGENIESPRVVITGLQLFNKQVSVGDSVDGIPILTKVINATNEIKLPYDQSVITLEFIGLDFTQPDRNHYAYKLQGLDREWNFVGREHSATYRYLKPGTYQFKVKCSNRADVWSDEQTTLTLIIQPPWWRTSWAYLTYMVTTALLVIFISKYGKKQISLRKRLKIEKTQRKHERRLAVEKLTFFTEISHEFRTPLTLIMGPLEEMLSKENTDSPNGRKLQMVHRNANKLLNLINKLIDYRKVESGNVILRISDNDIVPFVGDIFHSFQELARTRNINFTFNSEFQSMHVLFDAEKFEMVLNNLLSNSFKYIGSGNDIAIDISQQVSEKYPAGRAVIKIKDNGIGIPKKHLKHIFDWFYKGETSGSMNSGIGLSLARKLVNLHKGEIYVDSVEGQGSTFSVKIPLGKEHFKEDEVVFVEPPLLEQPAAIHNEGPEPDAESAGKRADNTLLIIEDDEEIRLFLKEYFSSTYKIVEASDGNAGFEMATTFHPDLIISDVMMPGMDGVELSKTLKSNVRTSHIPIILLTAKTSLIHQKEGIETGADAYITKPFSPEILALTVKNLLESRNKLMRFYRNLFVEKDNDQKNAGGNAEPTPDEKFLRSVYEQLMLNLDKPDFSVADLADMLNMSRSLIYKKIKMLTGLSPVEYVRSLRMQEAAKLLRTHQYKIFEVVYMVGFSDLKYFRQCFSKEFGMPPSAFMKQGDASVEKEQQ